MLIFKKPFASLAFVTRRFSSALVSLYLLLGLPIPASILR